MVKETIPFNSPYMTGKELGYIAEAHDRWQLAGDGPFTRRCQEWLEKKTGCAKALLTHSCTAALEMAALLLNIREGDEVIMPSYTFVSTANAFVLRGGVPVFVDVREDTLNLDETLIESAVTSRTRAIVPVHYGGVACEMDVIGAVAGRHGLSVVEDAAQGILSSYKGRALGSLGSLGTYSFHETKNVISGEGGSLLVNDRDLASRAEIIREKGTDRTLFFQGRVDKYTWQDMGSSFLPGELIAAFLWAQLGEADGITRARLRSWQYYHERLAPLEAEGRLRRPIVPEYCRHNGQTYYILLSPEIDRKAILDAFTKNGIGAVYHYVPLHTSPAGRRYCRAHGGFAVTDSVSERIIRLPLWVGLTEAQQDQVVGVLDRAVRASSSAARFSEHRISI